jgi:hypothetical protein
MLRARMQTVPKSLLLGCLSGCLALTVYILTIAPDITWSNFSSDGGELITASVTLGIAHPPGYPTYILLGKLFSLLPLGTIAFRFNLFSALAMAVAAAFATATAFENLRTDKTVWPAALAAGLAFAFSPLVWSQATVAEVYALNLAVLSIFLWSLLTKRSPLLTGFLLGLAITTHLTSLLMLPVGLALTPRDHRRRLTLGIILGILPLLALPLLGQLDSPVIWGVPMTLKGWWWLVSGQLYSANLSLPESSQALLNHLSQWSTTTLRQFAWIGWLFVIIGILANRLGERRTRCLLGSVAMYVVFTIAYSTNDSILNFLPALLLLTPLLAVGLTLVSYWSLLLPLLLLILNFQSQNLHHEQQLRPSVETVLREIPENAILLTPGDQSIFSLWYFQHVEGRRPDLFLVDANMFAFDWYRERLALRYPQLEGLSTDNVTSFQELNARIRPFCDLTLQAPQDVTCHSWSPSVPIPDG